MLTALRIEIGAFLPLIVLMGLSRRRGWLSDRGIAAITATYMGLFVGTTTLLVAAGSGEMLESSVTLLLLALGLSAFLGVASYFILIAMFRGWPRP